MAGAGKRRNSEKRKEKSRDAARCRRSKETEVFSELAKELPLPTCINQLDKASVMRVAISHLKIRQIMENMDSKGMNKKETIEDVDSLYSKALDGFVVIISESGDLVYLSESVAKYLGIPQIDMIGQSLYDFAHPCDHDEIGDMLSSKPHKGVEQEADERVFFVRMKCTLTSKGRNVNLKSASYKVIKFSGKLMVIREEKVMKEEEVDDDEEEDDDEDEEEEQVKHKKQMCYLLGVGEPIPHPSNIEVPLDCKTFLSRHNMDSKFTYCDSRMRDLVGYSSDELIGQSIFSYHHAQDSNVIDKAYKDLFAKGQMMTSQYRFLVKKGGFVWVITQGTVIYNNRTQKPQCVVCVHYVTSGVEQKSLILSDVQKLEEKQIKETIPWKFNPSTEDVFVTKTNKDEEEGFYFEGGLPKCQQGGLLDLQHLAPIAGDACVPLNTTFYTGDAKTTWPPVKDMPVSSMKEEPGTQRLCNKDLGKISSNSTPIGSPIPLKQDDYLSTINPSDIDAMDKFFTTIDLTQMQNSEVGLPDEEIDMDMRAPYIPMDSSNDFSLLPPTSDDIFNLSNDFNPGLFGRTETVFTPMDKLFPDPPQKMRLSLRDMLEGSTALATIEQPIDTFNLQMKRPLDKNSLERGPPLAKMPRKSAEHKDKHTRDSVLMNLLLTGEDRSHGYSVLNMLKDPSKKQPLKRFHSGELITADSRRPVHPSFLPKITERDCEVNAPSTMDGLLQGEALMQALDIGAFS